MIVFVASRIPPDHSGAGKPIYNYYNFLKQNGHEVVFITNTNINSDDCITVIKSTQTQGVFRKHKIFIDFLFSFFQIFFKFFYLRIVDTKIKTIWLVSSDTLTFAAVFVFKLLGYKIILQNTLVGSDDPAYRYPGDFLGIKYNLKKLQYRLSDKVTSISPALYYLSKKYHPNCVLIPYAFDPKFRSEKKYKKKPNNVLFVGALGYRKGIDIVFKAINEVHKVNPAINFTFVGPNENIDQSYLNFLKKAKNINKKNVHFIGYIEDPSPWFVKSDIFFMPSRREGFGIVFIEAMACGLPVVAKKLENITDYIFGENYPTILQTENPSKFAEAILFLINNNNEYMELLKLGMERVEKFKTENIYKKYFEIIV